MRTLILALLLIASGGTAAGQEPQAAEAKKTVETVEIEGTGVEQRLSAGLKDELQKLVGQVYDPKAADQFADRIQMELPEFIAASRILPGTQPDRVRLVFAVARITDRGPLGANINARYTVESVEIDGVPRSQVSDALYGDMQKMVGRPLDNDEADRLRDRLAMELGPRYGVDRQVVRGAPQQLRVFFYVYRIPWLPFRDPASFITYHQKQGLGFSLIVPIDLDDEITVRPPTPPPPPTPPGGRRTPAPPSTTVGLPVVRITHAKASTRRFTIGAANSADELIERYKGFRFGFEQRSLGTDRLGMKLLYTMYGERWAAQTELASLQAAGAADLYRSRRTFEPSVAFAFSPSLYVAAGARFTDLDMQFPATGERSASGGVGSVQFEHVFRSGTTIRHEVRAGYDGTAASNTFDSDFIYTRHFLGGQYTFARNKQWITLGLQGGRISGNAPLFDRFALGNTETLRGWNKTELTPIGGNRMIYGSFETGWEEVFVYYDAGGVWNPQEPIRIRSAVGIGLGDRAKAPDKGQFRLILGFRIEGTHLSPRVMLSARF